MIGRRGSGASAPLPDNLAEAIFTIVSGEGGRLSFDTLGRRLKLKGTAARRLPQFARDALGGDPRIEWHGDELLIKPRRPLPLNLRLEDLPVVVFDFETSGSTAGKDRAIELGMVAVERGKIAQEWESLFNPEGASVQRYVLKMTGITPVALRKAPAFVDLSPEIAEFVGDDVLIAHNLQFDKRFLDAEMIMATGSAPPNPAMCSFQISKRLLPNVHARGVEGLCGYFGLSTGKRHRALDDTRATAQIWLKLLEVASDHGVETFGDLWEMMGKTGVDP
jgi:DNA polymerase III epsilon subunit family exonuclease